MKSYLEYIKEDDIHKDIDPYEEENWEIPSHYKVGDWVVVLGALRSHEGNGIDGVIISQLLPLDTPGEHFRGNWDFQLSGMLQDEGDFIVKKPSLRRDEYRRITSNAIERYANPEEIQLAEQNDGCYQLIDR